ncbi:MAG TPA: PSD1 and planctomycete cytochrome C domain-containing protein [Isosphaeraceae bacterium]|nr:PSD1 and planctomycete cytochrome C domain-containing protein [Isosphaeraceae bacterium]
MGAPLRFRTVAALFLAIVCCESVCAQPAGNSDRSPPFLAEQISFFEKDVQPILRARCLKCHGEGPKIKGGLRIDSRAAILRGGELGPAVSVGEPAESLLLRAIHYDELEMPPGGKLPAREIAILTRWVELGLPWPGAKPRTPTASAPDRRPAAPPQPKAKVKDSWSYRPVARPPVPKVKNQGWCRTPIDPFVLARLEEERLAPAQPADRVTLIRRLRFDLTGLPPTPEEVDEFVADQAADAYERLVDRLLESPQHGEAWGRHWLDLVRYGETNGYERDSAKPLAWRYRDYVIDALNHDKPYDRFVREQIAGDEIAPGAAEPLIATGFYRLGIWDDEPADRALAHYDGLDNVLSTAGQVFLGISINCARCHDHKVDPISQREYYRLLAFFADVTDQDGKNFRKAVDRSGRRIDVMCVSERGRADTHILLRGNPNLRGDAVEPGVPAVLADPAPTFTDGPGKRRALADWLTDPRNPRTARALVNRLWQYHFGQGIVPTSNDFGGLGEPPSHPELLDWLAAEFMDGGWSIKKIHRLIVLSSAYRMSSRGSTRGLAVDPSNRWLWRFPMRRLTAEEIRDAILCASGTLNLKAGGPSVYPPIPRAVLSGQSVPGQGWTTSPPRDASRRSVYVHIKRSLLVPILAVHDAADTDTSCPVRYTTTVPTQALGFLNGEFSNEQAAHLALRIRRESRGSIESQVRRAIRLTTAREPTSEDVYADVDFIRKLTTGAQLEPEVALKQYCLLLLNANEFVYLD